MINLALEKRPVDVVAEIAERFDEAELKAAVADGRLAEWLFDRFEDEIADRVKALGGDTGGDDFTERLITALWPDPDSKEAKTARARVVAARARAVEAERQRQEAEAAKAKAEAEARAKKAEAEKLAAVLAAEQERKKAAQAKAEAERPTKKAKLASKEEASASSPAMALLQRVARSEADSHHLREARWFKIQWVNRKMDGWGIGVVFLDRNFREIGVKTSIMVDEYDAQMRPGSIVALGAAPKSAEAKQSRERGAAPRKGAAKRPCQTADATKISVNDEAVDDGEAEESVWFKAATKILADGLSSNPLQMGVRGVRAFADAALDQWWGKKK